LELGVLADDLTGGMMVASLLEREGVRCPLVTSTEALASLEAAEAVVLARKIRLIPADEARSEAEAAAGAFRAAGARRIYYKYCATFDSTPDGNIGPIADALLAATGAERTIICPAFPEYTVTVFQGRMFLGPTPLGESFKRHDPVTPMRNSNLVEVLQEQTGRKVGLLPHGTLIRGSEASETALGAQEGASLFVVDAVDDADVTRIAELTTDWPVTTGADALPMFLARTWRNRDVNRPLRAPLPPVSGHEAVIAGSCAGATLAQLDRFEQSHPVYRIDLESAAARPNLIDEITDWAAERLPDGPVAISTSADVDGVKRAQRVLGRAGAAELADSLLGEAARALHHLGVRRFVVAGGETSGQVFGSLALGRVEVSSFDELGGGYCHAPDEDPVSLVLKAGALGDTQFFFTALERMREDAARER
jgi:uncharacterized protein YgbK (DUF1537 family)